MKPIAKLLLPATIIILNFEFQISNCSAQYVTIPDSNFVNLLQANAELKGCMMGDLLDTSCVSVLSCKTLDCSNYGIDNLSGIKYFKSLDTLFGRDNNLITLPELPHSLRFIDLEFNQLNGLNNLPDSLTYLDCSGNYGIVILPPLPSELQYLALDYNFNTTSLPPLPITLVGLSCNTCAIDSLPPLPESLFYLYCSANSLTKLPTLPPYIIDLDCSYNNITTISPIPISMSHLEINNNYGFKCMPPFDAIYYFDFVNTALACLPDTGHVTISVPAINSLPLCDSINSNGCAFINSVQTINNVSLNIFPNPANNEITIATNNISPNTLYTITDLIGRTILSGNLNSSTNTINVSSLAACVYILQAGNELKQTFKIIKE